MSNAQFTVSNTARSDASVFTVPGDEPGTADSFRVDESGSGSKMHVYVHVDNGWDVNADVTLQGTHYNDDAMDSPTDDGGSETVNSGTADVFDSDVAHSFVQVSVDPASAPTSGDLVVTFQAREV